MQNRLNAFARYAFLVLHFIAIALLAAGTTAFHLLTQGGDHHG